MKPARLLTDDDAVSPVIGVILMVAITVVLAAVMGSFVLALGDNQTNETPTASFTFEYDETDTVGGTAYGFVKVKHDVGDTIANDELYIRGSGFHDSWAPPGTEPDLGSYTDPIASSGDRYVGSAGTWPANVGSGEDSAVVAGDYVFVGVSSDYELSVVYESAEGQSSTTLQSDTGPDA